MSDMPNDPISALAEAAVTVHELFIRYVDAGFTRAEALHLVTAGMMQAGISQAMKPEEGT